MKISAPGLELEVSARSPCTDEDWCWVHVIADVPGFSARLDAQLQGEDLSRFASEVGRLHESVGEPGTATLSSYERGLEVTLTMQRLGGISGRYRLESERVGGDPAVLSGPFERDQSFLPALRDDVLNLLDELKGGNEA
jgi:hypothetical protein